MVDFDGLLNAAVVGTFGELAAVTPTAGAPFDLAGDFHLGGELADPETEAAVSSRVPTFHYRRAELPPGVEIGQGSVLVIRGVAYRVADDDEDDSGFVTLELDLDR